MPAIEACFLMSQITKNNKQVIPKRAYKPPKDDLKSLKIIGGTLKDPTECTFAPKDDQNGDKVAPQDPKMPPKLCPRPIKISTFECKST